MSSAGLVATMTVEGSTNTDVFLTYLDQVLCPALRPGQTVILDNLAVHKNEAVRAKIEAAGCRLWFLPAYSPDFNPIEHAFAKLKQFLRKAKARTQEALETAVATGLATITAEDACGWFKHCEFPLNTQPVLKLAVGRASSPSPRRGYSRAGRSFVLWAASAHTDA